jgi:hypothetical protein
MPPRPPGPLHRHRPLHTCCLLPMCSTWAPSTMSLRPCTASSSWRRRCPRAVFYSGVALQRAWVCRRAGSPWPGQHGPCLPGVRHRRRAPRPAEQRNASPCTHTGWRHKYADPAPRRRPQHVCGRAARSWPSPRQCSAARAWPGGLRTNACDDIASMARSTGHRRRSATSRAHVLTILQARSQQRCRVESTVLDLILILCICIFRFSLHVVWL